MPRTKKPSSYAPTSGSAQLKTWLTGLSVPLINAPTMDQLTELAAQHREGMLALLKDPQVAASVDHSVRTAAQSCSTANAVQRVAQLLVDACWVSQALYSTQQPPATASNLGGTRTERFRELMAAAKSAKDLGKRLKSLTAKSLTTSHLLSRLAAGNETLFVHQRNGWNTSLPKSASPHVSDILETLAWELAEEAALLNINIEKNRQVGSSRRRFNTLMESLLQKSVNLGTQNLNGESTPDFGLVLAVVTSLHPNFPLDITTAQKRWASHQRKLKLKNS